jgi:molybdate transport system substrate-binding protein
MIPAGARLRAGLAALASAGLLFAGPACSGDSDAEPLTVGAASSLRTALSPTEELADGSPLRFTFAGSDLIAAQIDQGVAIDVFAAADEQLTGQLYREGLIDRPVEFAGNRLVIGVPPGSPVRSVGDLAADGVDLVIGDPSVPVGGYAREMIARLPPDQQKPVLGNVRSEEQDATSITAKLTQGAADAGILYATDVSAAGGQLAAIEIPDDLQPRIAYSAAVVEGSDQPGAGAEFISSLVSGEPAQDLRRAGFLPPPR